MHQPSEAEMLAAERKGYATERERAASDVILASMARRRGFFVRGDANSLPQRTDNTYDPRKR